MMQATVQTKYILSAIMLLLFIVCAVVCLSMPPRSSNAQTPVAPNASKNGICAIFYVEMVEYDDYTRSENKHFKDVARRFADTRKGRCYAMYNEDLVVNEVNVFKTGKNFLDTLGRISREVGKVSELYIFAHGVPLGIVGASEDSLGIQLMCVDSHCLSPSDFAFAIKQYLTNDANVVLHSCSVSVSPSDGYFRDQLFDETPLQMQSESIKAEQITASGTIIYSMNITSNENYVIHYNGYNAAGTLVIAGAVMVNGKRYPLKKQIDIHEFLDLDTVKNKSKHLSLPVSADWFTDEGDVPKDALQGTTIELDLTLEQEYSFAESLTREIARLDSTSKVTVWGHNNYTKAGYNCGWVKHTVDHPEASSVSATGKATDTMPLKLQCGSHATCDGKSPIVKSKVCNE